MTTTYKPEIRFFFRSYLLQLLSLIIFFYAFFVYLGEKEIIPAIIFFVVYTAIVTYLIYKYLYILKESWTMTEEQIIHIRGVIAIDKDYMELYRVYDFSEHSSVLDRIFQLKNIRIASTDHSSPELILRGININEDVLQNLRSKVETLKKQRNIYEITNS